MNTIEYVAPRRVPTRGELVKRLPFRIQGERTVAGRTQYLIDGDGRISWEWASAVAPTGSNEIYAKVGVESWELLSSQEKATVRRAFEASANDDDLSEAVTKKEVGVDSVRFICPFEI